MFNLNFFQFKKQIYDFYLLSLNDNVLSTLK